MSIPVKDLPIYKGTDKEVPLQVTDSSGAVDLSLDELYLYVRATISGDSVLTKDSDLVGGIVINPDQVANPGQATITIDAADTTSLDAGRYYYQVFHINSASKTTAILTGYFWIYEVGPNIVDSIRDLLGDGGELRINSVNDEIVAPAGLTTVYVPRQRITSVGGVWLDIDDDRSGTNYYIGGGFNPNTGKIWLGTPLVSTARYVRVDYTWESGVNTEAIWQHLHDSMIFTIQYTGVEFTYGNTTTNVTKAAEAMSIAGAIIGCILTMNGANVAQLGYNFRLHEFEVQTKLWGEGMIAEALFKVYQDEYRKWIQALGKAGQVHLVNRNFIQAKYNIETLLNIGSGAEGGEL